MDRRTNHWLTPVRSALGILCACVLSHFTGKARASESAVFISSRGLKLETQTGWGYYEGADAPDGAYLAANGSWSTQIVANVALGPPIAAGDYTMFIKTSDYDLRSRVDATLGNVSVGSVLNDRDADKNWTRLGPFHVTNATNSVHFVFTKTATATTKPRILLRALYLVPDPDNNVTVSSEDQVVKLQFATPADSDDGPPVKGNLIGNSSFEVGVQGGWSLSWLQKNWTRGSLWDTSVAYQGKSSLRFASQPSPPQALVSLPIRLKPNKRYSLSAYVRSSGGRQYATVRLVNSLNPPAGTPAAPVYLAGKLLTASSGWQRIVLSERILAYPGDQFHISLESQQYTEGGGSVWFDCVQLEEGNATPYMPRDTVDLGLLMPRADSIFYPNDLQGELLVANYSSASAVGTVKYEIDDHLLRVLKHGTIPVSVGGNSMKSYVLPLEVQKLGSFRGSVWTEDLSATEEEFLFSVVPVPTTTGLDESSTIGIHSDHTDWQLSMLQRVGIKWVRDMSPAAYFRWSLLEPTEGSFGWSDAKVGLPKNYGVSVLGNIGENAPAWAHRTYFALSNLVGTFRPGETVRTASGASGRVTLALDSTSATGVALQLANVQGVFAQGDLVAGAASRATAVVASSVFPTSIALDKWETFVQSVVSHFKTDVKWWEIWNEPHLDASEVPNAPFYAEMLGRAIRATKSADSTARVVAMGGIFQPDYGIEVLSKLPAGSIDDIAALSVHHYPGNGGVISLMKQTGQFNNKPIWNTETGTWDWGGYVGVNANVLQAGIPLFAHRASERFYRSLVDSPVLLARNFLQTVGGGASKYFYYDGRNSVSDANSFNSAPTLIDYHGGLKPKGVAYAILAHLFDHSTGLGSVTTRDSKTEAYLFDRAGVPSVGIFATDGAEREIDPSALIGSGSIQVFDFMGNPVPSQNLNIRYGRFPAYVRGVGISVAQMREAFGKGGIQAIPDTEAPRLAITLAPHRPVVVGDKLYLRWLALDNVSLPDSVQPEALMYSWKLEGSDADWTTWSPNTSVTYNAVRSGSHTFSVKARDQAGNVSAQRSREIIGVLPRPRNVKIAR